MIRRLARSALVRSVGTGLGYGLAVGLVDLSLATWNFTSKNLPAFTEGVLQSSGIHLGIGLVLGVVAFPLRGVVRAGGLVPLLGLTALWLPLAWWAAVDRAVVPMWATPALGGAVLVLLGRLVGARVATGIGVVALAALCVGPGLWQHLRDPSVVPHERPAPRSLAAGEAARPDVVVVVLDTVRAASMSAYGYGLPTTPNFDTLAQGGALFLDASAPGTWSLPSHASLFTGVYPSVHGAHEEHSSLDGVQTTLAEILSGAGYQSVAFTANPWISDHLGLTRGFAWSDEAWRDGGGGRAFFFAFRLLDRLGFGPTDKGGAEVAGHFEEWVASRPADSAPAFAFLNFLEAHFPHHQLPREYLSRFATLDDDELREYSRRLFASMFGAALGEIETNETKRPARQMYDAGVAYSDALLGRVVEALRRAGRLDRTMIVVLADHGELLGEHGEFGHGLSVFQPTMAVPLLLRFPGVVPAARVLPAVSTAAVLATVVDALGLGAPPVGVVPSLLPVLDGKPGGAPVLAERFAGRVAPGRTHPLLQGDVRLRVYRSGKWKLVESSGAPAMLYDLSADPDEERDVAGSEAAELARVKAELETWRAAMAIPELGQPGSAPAAEAAMDPAARERLKALGYVE